MFLAISLFLKHGITTKKVVLQRSYFIVLVLFHCFSHPPKMINIGDTQPMTGVEVLPHYGRGDGRRSSSR